jgi:hypothetical protein
LKFATISDRLNHTSLLSQFQVKLCRLFDSDPYSLMERQRATLHWGVEFIYIYGSFSIFTRSFAHLLP